MLSGIEFYDNLRAGLDSIWDRFGDFMTDAEVLAFNFVYDWMGANSDQVEDYINELNPFPDEEV